MRRKQKEALAQALAYVDYQSIDSRYLETFHFVTFCLLKFLSVGSGLACTLIIFLWGNAVRAGVVQLEEEKTPGRPYFSLSILKGGL